MNSDGCLDFIIFCHGRLPVSSVGISCWKYLRVPQEVDALGHLWKGVCITNEDCVKHPIVYVHALQSVVLRHNYYRQKPLEGRSFNEIRLAHSFNHFSHNFFGLRPCPVRKLHNKLRSKLQADSRRRDIDVSETIIPHVVEFCYMLLRRFQCTMGT